MASQTTPPLVWRAAVPTSEPLVWLALTKGQPGLNHSKTTGLPRKLASLTSLPSRSGSSKSGAAAPAASALAAGALVASVAGSEPTGVGPEAREHAKDNPRSATASGSGERML